MAVEEEGEEAAEVVAVVVAAAAVAAAAIREDTRLQPATAMNTLQAKLNLH